MGTNAAKVPSGTTDKFLLLHAVYSKKPPELLGEIEFLMMLHLIVYIGHCRLPLWRSTQHGFRYRLFADQQIPFPAPESLDLVSSIEREGWKTLREFFG